MAFIKNELNYKQRTYRTFLDAQKIFEDFNMNEIQRMEALNYILNHQEISDVLTYIYNSWGNNKTKVTPEMVQTQRAKPAPKSNNDIH